MSQETITYIDRSLKLLQEGLTPFVERQFKSRFGSVWQERVAERFKDAKAWDSYGLLKIMNTFWNEVFMHVQNPARAYVNETISVRNRWAHQQEFTLEDADRALDTMRRLLMATGNQDHAEKISTLRKQMSQTALEEPAPVALPPRILKDLSPVVPTPAPPPPPPSEKSDCPGQAHRPTVKQIACDLLCETIEVDGRQLGLSFDKILEKVREQLPDAKTTQNSLNCYMSQIRQGKHGYDQWAGRLPANRVSD